MARFSIEIYSDTTCPWCYLGRLHLDRALGAYHAAHPDAEFDVVCKPFYLFPDAQETSEYSRRDVITRKLGAERASRFFEQIERAAAEAGVPMYLNGPAGNTKAVHRLIWLARQRDAADAAAASASSSSTSASASAAATPPTLPPLSALDRDLEQQEQQQQQQPQPPGPARVRASLDETRQGRLLSALCRAQFADGRAVASRDFLAQLAVEHGLARTRADALAFLDDPAVRAAVDAEERAGRVGMGRLGPGMVTGGGVSAVPSFLVQGRYRVGGCQEPGVFLALFDKIAAAAEASSGGSSPSRGNGVAAGAGGVRGAA